MRARSSPGFRAFITPLASVTLAVAMGSMAIGAVAAQDTGDAAAFEADLFSDASEGAPGLSASADAARTEYLMGGTVAAKAAGYIASGFEGLTASSGVAGKLFAKVSIPDYGALYVAYNASFQFFQSYSGSGEAPAAVAPEAPMYGLSELHYSFDLAKVLFVRIGDQLLAWGPSRIWSPVDFINSQKADAFSSVDLRAGKPGLRLHLPMDRSNAFLFADFSGLVDGAAGVWTSGDPLQLVNLGGRLDFTAGPFEFGITGYGGMNAQARIGIDASGRLLGATVYGELAAAPGYDSYEQAVQASLGLSRTLDELRRWTLSIEGFYNSAGKDLRGYSASAIMTLPSAERIPLYQGQFYAYGSLAASELFSPSLSTTVSAIANLSDMSFSVTLAEAFSFPRAVPFSLSLGWSGGGADKEFTRYAGDGAMSATASVRMEF